MLHFQGHTLTAVYFIVKVNTFLSQPWHPSSHCPLSFPKCSTSPGKAIWVEGLHIGSPLFTPQVAATWLWFPVPLSPKNVIILVHDTHKKLENAKSMTLQPPESPGNGSLTGLWPRLWVSRQALNPHTVSLALALGSAHLDLALGSQRIRGIHGGYLPPISTLLPKTSTPARALASRAPGPTPTRLSTLELDTHLPISSADPGRTQGLAYTLARCGWPLALFPLHLSLPHCYGWILSLQNCWLCPALSLYYIEYGHF